MTLHSQAASDRAYLVELAESVRASDLDGAKEVLERFDRSERHRNDPAEPLTRYEAFDLVRTIVGTIGPLIARARGAPPPDALVDLMRDLDPERAP